MSDKSSNFAHRINKHILTIPKLSVMTENKKSPDAYDITKGEIELILAEIPNTNDGRISMNEIGKAAMAGLIICHILQISSLDLWDDLDQIYKEVSEMEEVKAIGYGFGEMFEFLTSDRLLTELGVPDLRHILTIVRCSVLSINNRIKGGELDPE